LPETKICTVAYLLETWLRDTISCKKELLMPKYHFDLVDARTAADEQDDARFCFDEEEAQVVAQTIATRLAASEPNFLKGYCVLVSNADGVEIYRVALGFAKDNSHD
jgi:hypothetical protein